MDSIHLWNRRSCNICIKNSDRVSLFAHHTGKRSCHHRLSDTAFSTYDTDYFFYMGILIWSYLHALLLFAWTAVCMCTAGTAFRRTWTIILFFCHLYFSPYSISAKSATKMASHCFAITLFIVALSPRIYQQVFPITHETACFFAYNCYFLFYFHIFIDTLSFWWYILYNFICNIFVIFLSYFIFLFCGFALCPEMKSLLIQLQEE